MISAWCPTLARPKIPHMTSTRSRTADRSDARNEPAYPLAEAARYLKVAPATLRSWVAGRPYPTGRGVRQFPPLIRPAGRTPPVLSFWNLIEAHVLRALRTDHGVSVKDVRTALRYAQGELGIQHSCCDANCAPRVASCFSSVTDS